MEQPYKYFAFISYNSKDILRGKWLHYKLEHYKLPSTLCQDHNWDRRPIKPVFFAPYDIQPGPLTEELKERLRASKNLIVICTPNSAQSDYVALEIEYFYRLGRLHNIHFFIMKGVPHSGNKKTECFNPIIDILKLPEYLGANIHERVYLLPYLNRERAFVQLISKLLSVEFDTIWQRHKRSLIKKAIRWTLGIAAIITIWLFSLKKTATFMSDITLNDITINDNLPVPKEKGKIQLLLNNDTIVDSIDLQSKRVELKRIPYQCFNKEARIVFSCSDYLQTDTLLFLSKTHIINIKRNPDVFGHICFKLYDIENQKYVSNGVIKFKGRMNEYQSVTDSLGNIDLFIPIHDQMKEYPIESSIPLSSSIIRMPCEKSRVITVKQSF